MEKEIQKCQNITHHLSPLLVGILGSSFLIFFYFVILFLVTKDLRHPWEQFLLNKYWISALILGFGVQMGFFQAIRLKKMFTTQTNMAAGTSAGFSSSAMVACCAHHLSDILPLLGISTASIFLAKYQTQFLALGVLANSVGIFLMARILFKREILTTKFSLPSLSKRGLAPILVFLFLIGLVLIFSRSDNSRFELNNSQNNPAVSASSFGTKIDSQAGIEVKVMPQKLGKREKENIFSVILDTHTGSLEFNFTQIMVLKDNLGNEYRPISWTGGQGGHHLLGEIIFPILNPKAQKVTLLVTTIGGVTRVFEWEI